MSQIPERFLTRAGAAADEEIEVPREDAPVVALFFALDTQWRRHPFTGQRMGIDYAAVKPTAELAGIELVPGILPALRAMELAAIETFAAAAQ